MSSNLTWTGLLNPGRQLKPSRFAYHSLPLGFFFFKAVVGGNLSQTKLLLSADTSPATCLWTPLLLSFSRTRHSSELCVGAMVLWGYAFFNEMLLPVPPHPSAPSPLFLSPDAFLGWLHWA